LHAASLTTGSEPSLQQDATNASDSLSAVSCTCHSITGLRSA